MPKVDFDTVSFVRGLLNPFGLWGRLLFDYADRYRLFVSAPILAEILKVLQRPEITRKIRSVADRSPHEILALVQSAEAVTLTDVPAISRDPKDDIFLATATAAQADYLVTEDEDMLVLQVHQGAKIVKASIFLLALDEMA